MTAQFFTSWDVATKGITQLIANSSAPDTAEVWRGPDGSYAIGQPQDIYDANEEADLDEWTDAGTVGEYRMAQEEAEEIG
jgi:hypothetical protein